MQPGRIGQRAWRSGNEGQVGDSRGKPPDEPAGTSHSPAPGRGWTRPTPVRPDHQAHADRMVRLSDYVNQTDRELLRAVFEFGRTVSELGRLMGLGESTVRSRLHSLIRRINSPAFLYAVRELDRMEPERAAVARLCVLQGAPLRVAAAELGLTVHRVTVLRRTIIDRARWDDNLARRAQARIPDAPSPHS